MTNATRAAAPILAAAKASMAALDAYAEANRRALKARLAPDGVPDSARLDQDQFAAHAGAWIATYIETLRQFLGWADRLAAAGRFGPLEELMLECGFGEYLAQLIHGIALSQTEIARPQDLGLEEAARRLEADTAAGQLARSGNTAEKRTRLAQLIADRGGGHFGALDGSDDTLTLVRDQFRTIAEELVLPEAHAWHLADTLIPDSVVAELGRLGVFGLTVPESFGGLGMGKSAMCVVTEELSRAFLGVGSLGTRSEIAAELIRTGGTQAQKETYLPKIASGAILPTAVFTEPDTGSDLGSLKTRAERKGDRWVVTGAKTWITHGARSDLMTLLARTDAKSPGYRGLSMFLAEKPRGSDADPFPVSGMRGSEIKVLGYRGMREYEIAFDGFEMPADALLGGVEGQGFKQLMATFESARIQTAARAVGVAQNALELAASYAGTRRQFGRPIGEFPRVGGKIAWMAVETMMARELTLFAARLKDSERRSDMEAGMAKLLAARTAWANADAAVQIHGGNGYAVEFPVSRVLVDARILNIFEGAGEIQAQVIARSLVAARN